MEISKNNEEDIKTNNSVQEESKRDLLFDNLKVLLIFLVIIGHVIELFILDNKVYEYSYIIIYFFHMPLFVFISGYFSKNIDKARKDGVIKFLLPYIIFNTIYAIFLKQNILISTYTPVHIYWYLLSMFYWKMSIKYLSKIKGIVIISILLALGCGLFAGINRVLSLSRTLVFFPFFLMGYFFNYGMKERLRKTPKILTILILISVSIIVCLAFDNGLINKELLYGTTSYKDMNYSNLVGVVTRFATIMISIIMSACFLILTPNSKTIYTRFGKGTITIYLFHIYVIKMLELIKGRIITLKAIPYYIGLPIFIAISILIILTLGNKWISKSYNKFIEKIKLLIFTGGN